MHDEYGARWRKARRTERLARTFAKYALTKAGYKPIFLLSKRGYESTGIVDMVGIKKWGDKMEIILFQVKGNQKVTKKEIERLRSTVKDMIVKCGIIEYKRGKWAKPRIIE